jgi:hypothetical protein
MSLDERNAYECWMEAERIPVHTGYDVSDIRTLQREPWAPRRQRLPHRPQRQEGFTNALVGEIAPGSTLKAQKHLSFRRWSTSLKAPATPTFGPGRGSA